MIESKNEMIHNRNHTQNGCHKIYPMNNCGMREGLSRDMLVSSRHNLVVHGFPANELTSM